MCIRCHRWQTILTIVNKIPYSINIFCYIFVSYEFFNFFRNMFNWKAVKIGQVIIINIQSYLMSCYWFILIKSYCICPILYFRLTTFWINTIKLKLSSNLAARHFDNTFVFQNLLKDEVALKTLSCSKCEMTCSNLSFTCSNLSFTC